MVVCFSCSHVSAGLLQKNSSRHGIIYDGITFLGKFGCWSKSNLDVGANQMFCYIDTLSENVFLMVLWYFVFHVVMFQQVCYRKIPLATGSSTMELLL
jgi:hypothetical protein